MKYITCNNLKFWWDESSLYHMKFDNKKNTADTGLKPFQNWFEWYLFQKPYKYL